MTDLTKAREVAQRLREYHSIHEEAADTIDALVLEIERLTKVDVEHDHKCPVCHHQQRSITYTCNNCGRGVDIEYQTVDEAGAKLEVENKRLRKALQSCLDYLKSPSTKNPLSDDMQADKIKEAMKVDI